VRRALACGKDMDHEAFGCREVYRRNFKHLWPWDNCRADV